MKLICSFWYLQSTQMIISTFYPLQKIFQKSLKNHREYDPSLFDGEKHIVLSTSNVIGGRNDTTYVAFFTLGILLILSGATIMILDARKKTKRMILTKPSSDSKGKPSRHQSQKYQAFDNNNAKDALEDQIDQDEPLSNNIGPRYGLGARSKRPQVQNYEEEKQLDNSDILGDKTSS